MRIIQDIFESVIQEQLTFHKIGTTIIKRKLESKGITLTGKQLSEIETKLRNFEEGSIIIDIDENQFSVFGAKSGDDPSTGLRISLSDSETDIDEILNQFSEKLKDLIPAIVDKISELILEKLKQDAPLMLKDKQRERKSFGSRLVRVWRKPLDLLEMFLVITLEAGDEFNKEFRPTASKEKDYVFEVLTRLHARACQIVSEILTLLRSGHADGAHARWRSLHEIAVVGFLIIKEFINI
jgi:hypothetical protein